MAVSLDNLDDMIKLFAKMEKAADTEVIREARKNMRATMRSYVPIFKKISPKKTGALIKSIKIKSKSKRGKSTVSLLWTVPYAGPVNFRESEVNRFASEKFYAEKQALNDKGEKDIRAAFKTVLESKGIKVL